MNDSGTPAADVIKAATGDGMRRGLGTRETSGKGGKPLLLEVGSRMTPCDLPEV